MSWRKSALLVVVVRPPEWRWPLLVPFPLFLLEELLEALAAVLPVAARLAPGRARALERRLAKFVRGQAGLAALQELGLRAPLAVVRALRQAGPFDLVEVRDGATSVVVKVV